MLELFTQVFDTSGFVPRWDCGRWWEPHGWLHIISDIGIWSAYVAIPLVLSFFILRKRDLPFRMMFVLFGAFILACGTTHLMEAVIFWWPAYRLAGLFKLIAAVVSWATVFALIPVTPRILAMRSPEELEREIAERKKAEHELMLRTIELDAKNKKLVEAERLKREFLANMSHEIRTPMNGIVGLTELLLDANPSADQRESLELVKFSAESLMNIINDILDFSKIEAGKLDIDSIPFQPRALLDNIVKALAHRAKAKNVDLRLNVMSEVPSEIVGDPGRLGQVLINLIGNAIKFTEKGAVAITVRVPVMPDGAARLRFAVADTGIGIPADKQQTIFQPFAQADGSMTRRFGGTGLGLSISAQLVTLMGGTLDVKSQVGVGSTFSFDFPLVRPTAIAETPTPAKQATRPATPVKVLVAEDNAVNQVVIRRILEKLGHTVRLVGNGGDAIAALRADRFDLVLMDVQMPDMDGFEVTRLIRAEEGAQAQIPVVAITAHAMKGDRERCLAAGMDDYVTKPVRTEALVAVINRLAHTTAA